MSSQDNTNQIEEQVHLSNCKIKYLQADSLRLIQDQQLMCNLIAKYKKLLEEYSSSNEIQTYYKMIPELNQKLEEALDAEDQKKKQYATQLYNLSHEQVDEILFWQLILSYEHQIYKIKQEQKNHQECKQLLQQNKQNRQFLEEIRQSTSILKNAEAYNAYQKVMEKYNRKMTNLKIKKKNLQNKLNLLNNQNNFDSQTNSTLSQNNDFQSKKTNFLITQLNDIPKRNNKQVLTPFMQTFLIYKKKRTQNQKLRDRNIRLKNVIANKQYAIGKIQNSPKFQPYDYENIWSNIQLQSQYNGKIHYDYHLNEFSIVDRTICHSFQLDQDISKVIKIGYGVDQTIN